MSAVVVIQGPNAGLRARHHAQRIPGSVVIPDATELAEVMVGANRQLAILAASEHLNLAERHHPGLVLAVDSLAVLTQRAAKRGWRVMT